MPEAHCLRPSRPPKRSIEEVPGRLFPGYGVRQDNAPDLVVALELADGALEEGVPERCVDQVRRIVAQHLGHVVVEDFLVNLLEA